MKELLAALELHFKKNRPELWVSLSAGLMNDAIAALQQDHKVLLPQSVKRLYRWHNGQHNQDGASFVNGYFFLPLERMLELVSALPDGYYPLFRSISGRYPACICYDASGRYKGKTGAIFCYYPDEPFDEDIADNLEAFIRLLNSYYNLITRKKKEEHFINIYGRKRIKNAE